MDFMGKAAGYVSQVVARTVKTEVQHLATGGTSTSTGQAGRSETKPISEQPRTQTQTDGTNKIVASDTSTVKGNTMIGKQRKRGRNAPSGSRTKRGRTESHEEEEESDEDESEEEEDESEEEEDESEEEEDESAEGQSDEEEEEPNEVRPRINTIVASETSTVTGNIMVGEQTTFYKRKKASKTNNASKVLKKKVTKTSKKPKKKAPKTKQNPKKKKPTTPVKPKATQKKHSKAIPPKRQKSKTTGRGRPQKKSKK